MSVNGLRAGAPDILRALAEQKLRTVNAKLASQSLATLRANALAHVDMRPSGLKAFEATLRAPGLSFIAECKKASPSKGLLAPEYNARAQARAYERAGAAAISVLTEESRFLGSLTDLSAVTQAVKVPVLRKDFFVHEAMFYEAALAGASAVLLIVRLLDDETLARFLALSESLKLAALVETHDEVEIARALALGAQVIGVNNRNLSTFGVDNERALRLRCAVPEHCTFVVESGLQTIDDMKRARDVGADAVLVGEALMRATDPIATLTAWKEATR